MEIRLALTDGTPVLVRPVAPADAPLIALGFSQLSDASRHFRWLRAMPALSEADLAALVSEPRPCDLVLGAAVVAGPDPEPAGIGRWICLPGDGARAEIAVTVVDRWQGRGLGTRLVACLAVLGAVRGLRAFVALVHARNRRMRTLVEGLGGTVTAREAGEVEYEIPLFTDPARWPETREGAALRAVARAIGAA